MDGDGTPELTQTVTFFVGLALILTVLIGVIPMVVAVDHLEVLPLAIGGGVAAVAVGAIAAVIRIVATKGRPFGHLDIELDRTSPYLREARRFERFIGIGVLALGAFGCGFAVVWYPNPHPDVQHLEMTPEEYALGVLIGAWLVIALAVCWLVLQAYWARLLRRAGRAREG